MKKAFDTYFGGKEASGVYQKIINHIRPHRVFAEPFGGNYAISRMINNNADVKAINDLDPGVYSRYPESTGKIRFRNKDYRGFCDDILAVYGTWPCVFYFDPPYPLESIKSSRAVYPFTMSDNEHDEFLKYAISIKGKADVLISTFPNEMYKAGLTDWHLVEYDGWSHKGKTTEWLFLNYDPAEITELHDARYYGRDFKERQRIARQINNMVRKIRYHPDPIIRNEVLKRINAL